MGAETTDWEDTSNETTKARAGWREKRRDAWSSVAGVAQEKNGTKGKRCSEEKSNAALSSRFSCRRNPGSKAAHVKRRPLRSAPPVATQEKRAERVSQDVAKNKTARLAARGYTWENKHLIVCVFCFLFSFSRTATKTCMGGSGGQLFNTSRAYTNCSARFCGGTSGETTVEKCLVSPCYSE